MPYAIPETSLITPYSAAPANESIPIYEGKVVVEKNGTKLPLEGSVKFVWQRQPAVVFSFSDNNPDGEDALLSAEVDLKLPTSTNKVGIKCTHVNRANNSAGSHIGYRGTVLDPLFIGRCSKVPVVIFHLANFHDTSGEMLTDDPAAAFNTWRGRFTLEAGQWRVTVDKVSSSGEIFKTLKGLGGYAITHLGKVEKIDGKNFDFAEFDPVKTDLFNFFSFVRGFWTEPFLEIGYNAEGHHRWVRWARPQTDSWKVVPSCFNCLEPEHLSGFWPNFTTRMNDPVWGDVLKRALFWYISCNLKSGGVEGSIVLAQAAQELLAWTKFASEKKLSESGFDKLPAFDKLRLLLIDAGIPREIPAELRFLRARAKSVNWSDGPEAVTGIRNMFVHPSPKNLKKMSALTANEINDAYILSMWYLDLSLLYLLGYMGSYYNRCIPGKWAGQTESVPWKSPAK